MAVKFYFYEDFVNAPGKVKFRRGLYLLLVAPLCLVGFPIYLAGTLIEIALDKLKDWLW